MRTIKDFSAIGFLVFLMIIISCENDETSEISAANITVIVNDISSNPVSDAEVKVFNDKEYVSTTDDSGKCSFSNLVTVNTIVSVKKEKFRPLYDSFILYEGNNTKILSIEPFEHFIEDFESGEFTDVWTLSGNANWFITNTESHSGFYSAKSGITGNSQQCSISTTVEVFENGMNLKFWYKLNIPNWGQFIEFYIDDTKIFSQSDEYDWQEFIISLPIGTHELKWTYNQYSSGNNSEGILIDDISISK